MTKLELKNETGGRFFAERGNAMKTMKEFIHTGGIKRSLEKTELGELKKGWTEIMISWGVMLASIGIYIIIGHLIIDKFPNNLSEDLPFPFELFRLALYGVCVLQLFVAGYLRKFIFKKRKILNSESKQNPAVYKYSFGMYVVSANLVAIGIFGFVLFLLDKDFFSLYFLNFVAAASMVYHRPQRDELINLANEMKRKSPGEEKE